MSSDSPKALHSCNSNQTAVYRDAYQDYWSIGGSELRIVKLCAENWKIVCNVFLDYACRFANYAQIVLIEYFAKSLSFFLIFLIWGDTHSLRMPVLRPASQADPMRNPRAGTSVVLRDTTRLT